MALARIVPESGVRPPARSPGRRAAPAQVRPIPRVSVVIVNYCLWEETAALTRQLIESPCTRKGDVEIVVVDNHSHAHPLAARMRRWPGVSLRRWRRNRGFAHAVNEGCRLGQGEWLLLLNPDISVSDDFLPRLLEFIQRLPEEEPRAGIVGFQLRNTDGTHQLSSGPFPTLPQTLARLTLPRHRRKYQFVRGQRRRKVAWVTGCCMLIRRQCLDQLGGLDRNFFLYYEDVDLCRRAQQQGWSVWFEPTLRAIHHQPIHRRTVPAHLRLLTRHALLTYARKHWPTWQFRVLTAIVALEARWRMARAQRRGEMDAAAVFARLLAITEKMRQGRFGDARRLLDELVIREEYRRAS